MGESVLRVEELQLDRGGRMVFALTRSSRSPKGKRVKIPVPGHGDSVSRPRGGPQGGNAMVLGEGRREPREELSFLCKERVPWNRLNRRKGRTFP